MLEVHTNYTGAYSSSKTKREETTRMEMTNIKPGMMPPKPEKKDCFTKGIHELGVSVPITVTPYARVKESKIVCCGKPEVIMCDKPCEGQKNGVCKFIISQVIGVEVPVEFGANIIAGDTYVKCHDCGRNPHCEEKPRDVFTDKPE